MKAHPIRSALCIGATVAITALSSACTAQLSGSAQTPATAQPVDVYGYQADYATVPPNYDAYPHYTYRGREAYYVNGGWYYQHDTGWVRFRSAPPELERQRTWVQQAPPAPRYYAPPAQPYYQQPAPAQPYYQPAPPREERRDDRREERRDDHRDR